MKVFIGEVIESGLNEWTNEKGDVMQTWRLAIILNDERGKRFNVSVNDPKYSEVSQYQKGDRVRIEAIPDVRNDDTVRWRITDIVLAETGDGPPDSVKGLI
jgi:hypothetical protein